jgi:hypothetical protein
MCVLTLSNTPSKIQVAISNSFGNKKYFQNQEHSRFFGHEGHPDKLYISQPSIDKQQ